VADRRHPRAGRRHLTLPLLAATTLKWGLSPLSPDSLHGQRQRVKKILLIVNGPAYGADETFNALRLAVALTRRGDTAINVFLMGDAVTCAIAGQKTPDGYYTLDRMLKTIHRHGGHLACCGTCLDARGLTKEHLIDEAPRSSMDELAAWSVESDQVVVV
jgi:uncharacterized protein involved in oxidation of intracellular sulfur